VSFACVHIGVIAAMTCGAWSAPHVAEHAPVGIAQAGGVKVVTPSYKVICADAGAGGYEAFPDICRCANGDILCVFYAGYGHVSLPNDALPRGARICSVRSTDEGLTWGAAQQVADTPWDDRDPSIACLSDGTLLCNWFTYYGTQEAAEPEKPAKYKELWLARSTDDGHTWAEPHLVPNTAGDHWGCSSPIVELTDGTLLWPIYREYPDPLRNWSAVIRSTDGGQTWSDPTWVDEGNDDNDEPALVELPNGRVLCVMRTSGGDSMWWCVSADKGATWTRSARIGFPGQAPYLFRTSDGLLLLGHRVPGTSLHYSADDGQTWSENVPIDDCIGAYPSMVGLKDGTVLFVYYEEGPGSSIRARRLAATREGVQVLPWPTE
jgi:sialidase-1